MPEGGLQAKTGPKTMHRTNSCFAGRAFLIAQLVKNLPAMQETPVRFLRWEVPLEKEMATHSASLA